MQRLKTEARCNAVVYFHLRPLDLEYAESKESICENATMIVCLACPYICSYLQVLDANRCFDKQCHSALSLQLAAYYYSLQIYSRLMPCFKDKNHTLYQVSVFVCMTQCLGG